MKPWPEPARAICLLHSARGFAEVFPALGVNDGPTPGGGSGEGVSEAPRGRKGLTGQADAGAAQLLVEQPNPLAARATGQSQITARTSPAQKKERNWSWRRGMTVAS